MSLAETSLSAWDIIESSPYIGKMQKRVAQAIWDNPGITDQQIARVIEKPINCVTPRRGELQEMGVIIAVGISQSRETKMERFKWAINKHGLETLGVKKRSKKAKQLVLDDPKDTDLVRLKTLLCKLGFSYRETNYDGETTIRTLLRFDANGKAIV